MLKKNEKKLRPYNKPNIKVIELFADEVLAVGCKTSVIHSGKNPSYGSFSCLALSKCFEQAS